MIRLFEMYLFQETFVHSFSIWFKSSYFLSVTLRLCFFKHKNPLKAHMQWLALNSSTEVLHSNTIDRTSSSVLWFAAATCVTMLSNNKPCSSSKTPIFFERQRTWQKDSSSCVYSWFLYLARCSAEMWFSVAHSSW